MVVKSHALQLENFSLSFLEQVFSYPVYFANDANAAMMAEDMHEYQDAVYLSLNNTLGGAFCINGKLVAGQNQKAGEFGHMILVPGGKKCYCENAVRQIVERVTVLSADEILVRIKGGAEIKQRLER